MKIDSITSDGLVLVTWALKTVFFTNKVPIFGRRLSKQLPLKISITPGSSKQLVENLNFTYEVKSVNSTHLLLKFYFSSPLFVSMTSADLLRIEFTDLSIFNVTSNDTHGLSSFGLTKKLPRQKSAEEATYDMAPTENLMMTAFGSAIAFTFASSFVLNHVLSMVEGLTMFLHLCLITLNYPSNVISFFKTFFPLVTFDPISTDTIYESIFKFS
jgi:hypothetical protein